MESKQILSQIEFKFTRPSYPVSEKVISYFGTTTPQTGDWVGLFRVGWKSVKEHHSKKPVSLETIELSKKVNIDYSFVVFEKSELPKDKDSYYQFVYVSKDDVVRGASRPFQFEWESVELKDELKQLRQQMWSTIEQQQEQPRELWSKIVIEEKEREIREREREQREKERELREFERVERERERERELREKELREVRELREIRERKQSEKERELREREREEREWSKERRRHHEKESRRQEKERDSSLQRKTRRSDLNNNTSKLVELLVESEKDMSSRSTWEKLEEEQILAKLMQKHMPYSTSSIKPTKKEEEVIKKVEELFLENSKLSSTLRSKHSELVDLKKECEELKQFNTELVSKLSHEGRKLETVERELESEREVLRKLEEQKEREQYERPESRKHYLEKEEEKKYLLKEENERLREELRRLSHLYQTESSKHSSLKSKLLKIDESLVKKITKRLSEKRSISEIEESTLEEIKTLKKLIDELVETEIIKDRIKYESEYPKLEVTVPVTSKTTIIKEKSTTTSSSSLPRINSQPEYLSLIETRPIQLVQETYPSISVSTSIPEITLKSSGKVSVPVSEQLVRESELLMSKLEQQLKKKSIEELKSKLVELREMRESQKETSKPTPSSSYWVYSTVPQSLPTEIKEQELIEKKLKAQQQKQFLKQYEEQARHHLRSESPSSSSYTSICPVCGIAVSKELNQVEFELHVNSHFTD